MQIEKRILAGVYDSDQFYYCITDSEKGSGEYYILHELKDSREKYYEQVPVELLEGLAKSIDKSYKINDSLHIHISKCTKKDNINRVSYKALVSTRYHNTKEFTNGFYMYDTTLKKTTKTMFSILDDNHFMGMVAFTRYYHTIMQYNICCKD